jgi:amidase
VAVAANLCAVAVGTETNGSILSPASYNGIVGIKPTVGRVSRSGIVPIAQSQDTAGPMARTVADAAILLEVLAGRDLNDAAMLEASGAETGAYVKSLTRDGLRGARLGVVRGLFGPVEAADRLINGVLSEMERFGAVLVDPVRLELPGELWKAESEVLHCEFKAGLDGYLSGRGPALSVRSLADVIDFNERHRKEELCWFGQENMVWAQAKGPLTDPAYVEAAQLCRRLTRVEGIDAVMDEHRLDGLVAPTTGPAHVTDYVLGDRDTGSSSSPAAIAGNPSITVPAGQVQGLPVGLSFFGRAWSEAVLLRLAYAFEQLVGGRRPPTFRPTV